MKRFILAFITILLCILAVHAQLLWRIDGPNAKTSYIFGTHHLAPVSMLDSVAGLSEAFGKCSAVCGEVVMADISAPEGQQQLLVAGTAPADSTLSRLLSPAQLDSLQTLLVKYLGPQTRVTMMNQFKPAMISTMLAMLLNKQAMPEVDPTQQLDAVIQTLAISKGEAVHGLETVAEQAQVLFGAPLHHQAEDLMRVVRDEAGQLALTRRLANAYISQNLNEVNEILNLPESGMTGAARKVLITDRNTAWIP